MNLLVEVNENYGKYYLSINVAARDALITAINLAVGESPRPKVGQPSVVGMITAKCLGQCVEIKAANQKVIVRTENVPALLEALANANTSNSILNAPQVIETSTGCIGVMCFEPPQDEPLTE
ncbi:hypothetical protein [uncultured Agitococcus sp.]|uniref:hypothetical protein n=1 Tax=uncultured Agitococcus sp. TaxID=1506599 RepID=UPI002612EE66|nr:hypothetical protein [uncultured Agitococcus sp.]